MAREMPSDSGCIWSKGTVNVRKNMTPNFFFFFLEQQRWIQYQLGWKTASGEDFSQAAGRP